MGEKRCCLLLYSMKEKIFLEANYKYNGGEGDISFSDCNVHVNDVTNLLACLYMYYHWRSNYQDVGICDPIN